VVHNTLAWVLPHAQSKVRHGVSHVFGVGALSIELANPRHQHEYAVFKQSPLPDSMVLIPGVIDPKTDYVEHPQVVENRILQAVETVGDRSRVIARVDCGFSTVAGYNMVAESVVWAKLRTLREGADLASARLWG
jgi:5-methyltetrahydropteroyltriglutamate--homocysteine methyltransferase